MNVRLGFTCIAISLLATSAFSQQPEFPVLGKVKSRSAKEIASSSWSIGGETLDRDFAVYANYKKYLGPLGAKHIRLQAGWAKCEKTPGVYDFAWLDEIVDDARTQGVQPWLETSYGNTIYPGGGGTGLGGGFPKTPEAIAAWDKWVKALVAHFKDRVNEWEIWNEPDGGKSNTPEAYAGLFIRTAETIRGEQPKAKIFALGLAGNLNFAEKFLEAVKAGNKLGLIDVLTIHGYPKNPDDTLPMDKARAMVAQFSAAIEIRQGETGACSTFQPHYALSNMPWSENTQAKWDLRRMLAHRAKDVPFNLFTISDMHYVRDGKTDMNYKGLLGTNPDKTISHAKPAYFAAQNVFAIFDDTLERIADCSFESNTTNKLTVSAYRSKTAGAQLVAIWFGGSPVAETNATTPVNFTFKAAQFKEPVLVDLLNGRVRGVPASNWKQEADGCSFRGIPVYDSPVLIAERTLLPIIGN